MFVAQNVSLDENLQLNCLNWGNIPVVSGGLVDNHWPNYSPIHRPVLELDFVLLQLVCVLCFPFTPLDLTVGAVRDRNITLGTRMWVRHTRGPMCLRLAP
jgi:hypothetical protein